MSVQKVKIHQLRALARNENSCQEIAIENNFEDGDPIRFTKTYTVKLMDIQRAVEITRERGRNGWKSFIDWAIALTEIPIASGLVFPTEPAPLLPRTGQDYLACVMKKIHIFTIKTIRDYWSFEEQEWDVVKIRRAVKEFLDILDMYFNSYKTNRDKDPVEWTVIPPIGEEYIMEMNERMYDDTVSDEDCAIFRHFANTLVAKNNEIAIHAVAYLYYNGTKAYPQNWKKSRSLLEKLFKRTMDPECANSLGYIYYYGRCTNGEPEYEKAFTYFHYAAGHGVIEADYKLADMYLHGYGTFKNVQAADRIITTSFDELLDRFRQGEYDGKFADIALRKGRLMESLVEEAPCEKDAFYILAHKYYLMAELAIRARRTSVSLYGDEKVEENIKKALENIRKHIPPTPAGQLSPIMSNINELCSINGPVKVRFEVTEIDPDDLPENFDEETGDINGSICTMKIWFADKDSGARRGNMLITIPEADYCGLENEAIAHVYVSNSDSIRLDTFWCTRISRNEENGMLEFYRFSELMQALPSSIHLAASYDKPTQFYRMADVVFSNSADERSYTYLCPQLDIHTDDEVWVMAGHNKTTAKVESIYLASDVDLELPFEKYKTILQKI